MTFEEKLDRARTGSRAAYESLCLGSIDKLYTAAVIALKDEKIARSAVISAINDGYAGISRIRDERHLRSWLVHELTKNAVDKLKEFKAGGVSHSASGVFAETGNMPDVERLVFSVSCVFGYGTREVSVLTGMAEDTITEKLSSAKKRLGAQYGNICSEAEHFKAPEQLRERYVGFDESLARLEQSEAAAPVETNAPEAEPTPSEPELPKKPEPIAEEPEPTTEKPEPIAEKTEPIAEEPKPIVEEQVKPFAPEAAHETAHEEDESVFSEEEEYGEDGEEYAEDDKYSEGDDEYYDEEDAGYETKELVFDKPEKSTSDEGLPAKLNAETFIAVVSAEKMKGNEFLRLIGNTRISNSAYREIEQNPRLTKKRLIQLLEESPLTENDYYKLLMAVRDRREILDAKEENRLALERAGLYDGSRREKYRRKRREKPKTELEMAIGISKDRKPEQPLTFDQDLVMEDDSDFQLQNSTGNFEQQKILSERRKKEKQRIDMDLGAVINADRNESDAVDPLSHTALHDIFDDDDYEPIDPFAAISANDTGKQAKPSRIDTQRDEWYHGDASANDKPIVGDMLATAEFDAPAEVSDTRQFDAVSPEIVWNNDAGDEEAAAQESGSDDRIIASDADSGTPKDESAHRPVWEQKAPESFDLSFTDDDEEDNVITTTPIQDGVSVTQIISEYAIGEAVSDYAAEQAAAAAPVVTPDKEEEPENKGGYSPKVGLVFDVASDAMDSDEADDLSFSFGESEEAEKRPAAEQHTVKEKHGAKHENVGATEKPEPLPKPDPNKSDEGDIDDFDDDIEDGASRKRYKGNEFFVDDNEYYEGVNRGKIITCAVLAVLLAAGSAGMKYLPFSSGNNEPVINDTAITEKINETTDVPEDKSTEEYAVPEEVTLSKLSSYDDMTSGNYERAELTTKAVSGYLRASSEPYPSDIVYGGAAASVLFTEDTAYIYSVQNDCSLRAFHIGEPEITVSEDDSDAGEEGEASAEEASEAVDALHIDEALLYAYTSINGDLYTVCGKADKNGSELYETQITVYGKDLSKKGEYVISGKFSGAGIVNGKLTVAATGSPAEYAGAYNNGLAVSKHPYYSENGEFREISASDIYTVDGVKHNTVNIIYTVGGGEPLAILGGNGCFVKFGEFDITAALPDGGITYGIEIAKDLQIISAKAYMGDAFSADCIGNGGMIGQTDSGICAYKNGKTVSVQDETAYSAAWSERGIAYVVTENSDGQKMLYGFDMSGDAPESAQIAASDIYTDKLANVGENLVGLKAEPASDGERAGLRISMYEYDGALKETAYSIIELDKDTPRENLKYLSSPAETLPTFIGTNEDGTMYAVPTVYFDGYSEVERVVVLSWDGTLFSVCGEYITYDEKSSVIGAAIRGSKLYVITDTNVAESDLTPEE